MPLDHEALGGDSILEALKRIEDRQAKLTHDLGMLTWSVDWMKTNWYGIHHHIGSVKDDLALLGGQIAARLPAENAEMARFKAFSQYGEDGIIQYIVRRTQLKVKKFIEFGVGNYTEANTKFLMMHDNWEGLIIDGNDAYINEIRARQEYGWKYALRARCDFLTPDNINDIFRQEGFVGDIGLLSVDIDGVDYWVWEAISVVRPAIIIAEYNRTWPVDRPITVKYRADFDRTKAHPSNLYFGIGLAACLHLAKKRGYRMVAIEPHRANVFFVLDELCADLPEIKILPEHQAPGSDAHLKLIRGFEVVNVATGKIETI